MSDYDPSTDARYLGSLDDTETRRAEARAQELGFDLGRLDACIALFERPEWTEVYDLIDKQREFAADRLLKGFCQTLGMYEHERGRVKAYDFVLQLPNSVRAQREEVLQELRQLSDDGSPQGE